MKEHRKPWQPISVKAVNAVFGTAPFRWCIAGGYAIDLAIGHTTREHADLDVLISHRDHAAVRRWLREWDCWQADPPGRLRPWKIDESLDHKVHDIWCRSCPQDRWRFQLMLDNGDTERWISRRSPAIAAPWSTIVRETLDGTPYLAPHVQLFYKAKSPRSKDHADFDNVAGRLNAKEHDWLIDAIGRCYGTGHAWLERLMRNSHGGTSHE